MNEQSEQSAPVAPVVSETNNNRPRRKPAKRFWFVVAVLFGVASAFAWWSYDFSQSITVGSETFNLPSLADHFIAAFIAGVAGMFAVIALSPEN